MYDRRTMRSGEFSSPDLLQRQKAKALPSLRIITGVVGGQADGYPGVSLGRVNRYERLCSI